MTDTLTPSEIQILAEIAGLMIPKSDLHKVPGADEPGILAEIVEDANTNAAADVKAALAAWAGLDAESETLRVEAFLRHCKDEAALLQAVVNRVYYRNDAVMASLGMEARAPFPKGFEVEEVDWSILDPVRKLDPIWRPAG